MPIPTTRHPKERRRWPATTPKGCGPFWCAAPVGKRVTSSIRPWTRPRCGRTSARSAWPNSRRRPRSSATTRRSCWATATRACPAPRPTPGPDSFAQAPLDEAVGRLVAVIRRERPQVILTYPDEQSEYPHPDHLRVHEISLAAFDAAGDPDRFPEAGEPFVAPEALLLGVAGRALPADPRQVPRAGDGVAIRRETAGALDPRRPLHDSDRRAGLRGGAGGSRSRRMPPRSIRTHRSGSASPPRSLEEINPVDQFRLAHSRVGGPHRRRPVRRGALRYRGAEPSAERPYRRTICSPELR